MTELEQQLRELIVSSLQLEDLRAEDIDVEQPLFGEGLGLDSIDALELAIAIDRKFGVKFQSDGEQAKQAFASVRALAAFIDKARG